VNPTDLVKELTKVLKFLPLRKLTANQTFDLFWDVVSLTFVIAVLFTKDVGPGGNRYTASGSRLLYRFHELVIGGKHTVSLSGDSRYAIPQVPFDQPALALL